MAAPLVNPGAFRVLLPLAWVHRGHKLRGYAGLQKDRMRVLAVAPHCAFRWPSAPARVRIGCRVTTGDEPHPPLIPNRNRRQQQAPDDPTDHRPNQAGCRASPPTAQSPSKIKKTAAPTTRNRRSLLQGGSAALATHPALLCGLPAHLAANSTTPRTSNAAESWAVLRHLDAVRSRRRVTFV